MSQEEGVLVIRRILVALDASTHSLAALEAAATLAAAAEAELLGIFVEDTNLLRLARMPFARQIIFPSAIAEPLDTTRIERELRVQAERARKALATTAERVQVRSSFRVVRGQIAPEVLAAASDTDLLTLGKSSWSLTGRALSSTLLASIRDVPQALLFIRHNVPLKPPVMVVYDGSSPSRYAVTAAARLAKTVGDGLTVLIPSDDSTVGRRLAHEAASLAGEQAVRYRPVRARNVITLMHAVQEERGAVLVLSSLAWLGRPEIARLVHELENPVLLLTPRPAELVNRVAKESYPV